MANPREDHFMTLSVATEAGEEWRIQFLNGLYGVPTVAFGFLSISSRTIGIRIDSRLSMQFPMPEMSSRLIPPFLQDTKEAAQYQL